LSWEELGKTQSLDKFNSVINELRPLVRLTNLVEGKVFTGFKAGSATIAVSNGVAVITGNGTANNPRMYRNLSGVTPGHIYFGSVKVKVTNDVCQKITLSVYGTNSIEMVDDSKSILLPEKDKEYDISVCSKIVPEGATSLLSIRIESVYENAITANEKVLEVRSINLVDVTELIGTFPRLNASILGSSILALENGYIDGTRNVELSKYNDDDYVLAKNGVMISSKKFSSFFEVGGVIQDAPATHQALHSMYDGIVSDYPDYVEKSVLGTNAEGYELIQYKFSKPQLVNHVGITRPKIGILSGLHGDEKNPAIGIYSFMRALCDNENDNEVIERIKSLVDFYVVPCGNPTGWNNNTRNNGNNVNLNRNFDINWDSQQKDAGASAASESETQLLQAWLTANEFDHFIDYHNSVQVEDRICWMVTDDIEIDNAFYKALSLVSVLWSKRYPEFPSNKMFGNMPAYNPLAQSWRYAQSLGTKSCIIETSWRVFYGMESLVSNTISSELIGNYIFELCKSLYL
jgi:hypothetical protein